MAIHPMSRVIHGLRQLALTHEGMPLTDGQLLERFVSRREPAALEASVQRHGPMVWGVCRRLLHHQDAEDAFQATFLILVRKAAAVVSREMVGNWLYGVAHQAALNARTRIARRRAREVQVAAMPEPAVSDPDRWRDMRPFLDQELSRLPDTYRVVVVLCDLEGKSRKEAARQLDLPEGTVASRLARARAMLAKRLARHGLAVSGGALAAALAQNAASAGVPPLVVSVTIKAVTAVAAGQAAASAISAPVAALTEGVLKAMLLTKLKTAVTVVLVLGMVAFGGGLLTQSTGAGEKPRTKPADEVRAKDADREAATGSLLDAEQELLQAESEVERAKANLDQAQADYDKAQKAQREKAAEAIKANHRLADKQPPIAPKSQKEMGILPRSSEPAPVQALVSLKNGKLVVRTQVMESATPATYKFDGKNITYYIVNEKVATAEYDLKDVKVRDVKGKRIEVEELPKLLKKEIVALITKDGFVVDPLHLRLFKDGTLLFLLPLPDPAPVSAHPADEMPVQPKPAPPAPAPIPVPPEPKDGQRNKPMTDVSSPPEVAPSRKAAAQREYVIAARLLEAGADQPKEVLRLPKATVDEGQLITIGIPDGPKNLLTKVLDDEYIKIGTFFDVRVTHLGENKVRLFCSLQRNELEKSSVSEIRVLGHNAQAIQDVELHKPVKIVLQKDTSGSAQRWVEITVDE